MWTQDREQTWERKDTYGNKRREITNTKKKHKDIDMETNTKQANRQGIRTRSERTPTRESTQGHKATGSRTNTGTRRYKHNEQTHGFKCTSSGRKYTDVKSKHWNRRTAAPEKETLRHKHRDTKTLVWRQRGAWHGLKCTRSRTRRKKFYCIVW